MKCLKCGYIIVKNVKKCPCCGFYNSEKAQKEKILSLDVEDKTLIDLRQRLAVLQDDIEEDDKSFVKEDVKLNLREASSNDGDIRNGRNNKKDIKNDFENIDLEKTIAISVGGDTKDFPGLSLIDEINKQIDDVNEEVKTEPELEMPLTLEEKLRNLSDTSKVVDKVVKDDEQKGVKIEEDIKDQEEAEENKKVVGTKTKVFLMTGVVVLAFIFSVLFFFWFIVGNNTGHEAKINYVDKMNVAMQTYYETENIDDIIFILNEVKDDEEKVRELQSKARSICDSWVLLYLNEELEDVEGFEAATVKYKNLIERLYSNAIIQTDDGLVRVLTEKDRDDLLGQFDDIYTDSAIFYDALELYNKKEYNDAYYMFNRIEMSNSYYEKGVTYSNNIIDSIMDMINNDINKLEKNIESLDNDDKLRIYTSIEQIILDYANVYFNIPLADNDEYQELLSEYTSKVSEYSTVMNESNGVTE